METGDTPLVFKTLAERIEANCDVIRDYEIRELIRQAVIDGIRSTVYPALSKMSRRIEVVIGGAEEEMMQTLREGMWDAFDRAITEQKNYFKD